MDKAQNFVSTKPLKMRGVIASKWKLLWNKKDAWYLVRCASQRMNAQNMTGTQHVATKARATDGTFILNLLYYEKLSCTTSISAQAYYFANEFFDEKVALYFGNILRYLAFMCIGVWYSHMRGSYHSGVRTKRGVALTWDSEKYQYSMALEQRQ